MHHSRAMCVLLMFSSVQSFADLLFMMNRHSVIGIATTVVCSMAYASDESATQFSFGGYGTVGMVHSSEQHADFAANPLLGGRVGTAEQWSPNVDSRIAGQLGAQFTSSLSGVIQMVAERRADNTYKPTIEWGNLRYQVSQSLSVRLGRIALPVLMAAEYRKVGYSVPWVRTPVEVYGLVPITTSDGVDASLRTRHGPVTNTIKASWGHNHMRLGEGYGSAEINQLVGASDVVEFGATTLRAGYIRGDLDVPAVQPFFDAFRAFGTRGASLAERYELNDKKASVLSIGGSYDPGAWFVTAEWARSRTHSLLGDKQGWYTGGGYRFGDFTPYITYARVHTRTPQSDSGISTAGLPRAAAASAVALNASLNRYLASSPNQRTVAVGARWDFARNVALKMQYDRISLGPNSWGTLVNVQPGFISGGTVHVATVTVDFVF